MSDELLLAFFTILSSLLQTKKWIKTNHQMLWNCNLHRPIVIVKSCYVNSQFSNNSLRFFKCHFKRFLGYDFMNSKMILKMPLTNIFSVSATGSSESASMITERIRQILNLFRYFTFYWSFIFAGRHRQAFRIHAEANWLRYTSWRYYYSFTAQQPKASGEAHYSRRNWNFRRSCSKKYESLAMVTCKILSNSAGT